MSVGDQQTNPPFQTRGDQKTRLPQVLVDQCLPGAVYKTLGLDCQWVGMRWKQDPGDTVILDTAYGEGLVVATADWDFKNLVLEQRRPNRGVILLHEIRTTVEQINYIERALSDYHQTFTEKGGIVVVSHGEMTFSTPPDGPKTVSAPKPKPPFVRRPRNWSRTHGP